MIGHDILSEEFVAELILGVGIGRTEQEAH